MAVIEVIEYEKSKGRLKEIYEDIIAKRGKLAEVHKLQSLNPESIVKHMDLYMQIMFGESPLKRWQREMIAVVVSSVNKCDYCIEHHANALLNYWKDSEKVNRLVANYQNVGLDEINTNFCLYAQVLTKNPESKNSDLVLKKLKYNGVTDRAILDATLIIAYFNFVNRLILGLGVEFSTDETKGYKY